MNWIELVWGCLPAVHVYCMLVVAWAVETVEMMEYGGGGTVGVQPWDSRTPHGMNRNGSSSIYNSCPASFQ